MKGQLVLVLLVLFISASFSSSGQSNKVKSGPRKPWVEKITFDHNATPLAGQESGYYYLLSDHQENVSTEEHFVHSAYKILSNEGLQEMSDLSAEFDPAYETITFHEISIHRNGQVMNQLPKQIKTLQREESMDRFLYDGSLTAVINLTDVRIGDIVEYSFTRKGYNPVYDHHFSSQITFTYSVAVEKQVDRLIVPNTLDLSFKYLNKEITPEIKKEQGHISYTWVNNKVSGIIRDTNEPSWYYPYDEVLVSDFKNWGEVAQWATRRFQISEQDKQQVAREFLPKFKSSDPAEYALEVIRFVQDEIRYLGFESGLNSHKPHAPAQVYNQRFGDCKDKALLLSTLLNAKGIEAYPVLVNTIYRSKLSEQIPLTTSFNHCVVEIKLNNKAYYIDPTISSQGGKLDNYFFPTYGKGLVVNDKTTDLIDFPEPVVSTVHETQNFDLAAIGGEGMLKIETTYRGAEADNQRSYFANNSMEATQKAYLTYYGNLYSDIQTFEPITTEDNREENVFKVKEHYKIPTFWKPYKEQEGVVYCEFYPLALENSFNVSKSATRIAPYSLIHPFSFSHEIYVELPEEWTIVNDQSEIQSDYYQYSHKTTYDNKVLSLLTHYSTKAESVPVVHFGKFVEDHSKMMANLNYALTYDTSLVTKASNKWPGVMLTIFSLGLGVVLMYSVYTKYDPIPFYSTEYEIPIGGWLILIGLGVLVSPLLLLSQFFSNDYMLSGQAWLSMWHSGRYGYFIFLFLEHIYNVVLLAFSILIAILFYQKRSSLPRMISIFYAVSCAATILDIVVAVQMEPSTEIPYRDVLRSIFVAVVWIPYFNMSVRVKETFVHRKNPDDDVDGMATQSV
ncbi:MAG: DUF3857 domain-containing protein [Chryseolinea sp.]